MRVVVYARVSSVDQEPPESAPQRDTVPASSSRMERRSQWRSCTPLRRARHRHGSRCLPAPPRRCTEPQAGGPAESEEDKIGSPHWTIFRNWLIREAA